MLAPPSITAQSLQAFWDAAIARGLFPLAIARGTKAPIGEGWNTWTHPIAHPGAGGVGLRCGDNGLTAFDVDVLDPALSPKLLAAFRSVLGPNIPVRWGREPKFLIPFYLVDAPVKGRAFTFANGELLQLMGGQFVAFGEHKDTKLPYRWENWERDWPRLTAEQLLKVLSEVPFIAGTSLGFATEHELASADELKYSIPQTQDELQAGRGAAECYLGKLKYELLGKTERRGTEIFKYVGILKFAAQHGMCTQREIEDAVTEAGHGLDEGLGGRTLGGEINRHDELPVLRGNLIMQAIMSRRTMLQGLADAQIAPTLASRTGFEISLEDASAELPWLLYQRILCGEVHFFTGHNGAGKSALVTDMAVQLIRGQSWLDADNERVNGHVLWVAAEDDYGTERRVRYLLRQEPNALELADRFHLIREVKPMAFEQQCVAQVQSMIAMGKRVDMIVLDTWGASGLCFADNDTEAVLKAMFILKSVARRTNAALIITDHLPLGNEEAWQKGNGAKSGNAGFVYRITGARNDYVSIDCGKARGAPKAKSYTGRIVSENYGKDVKGRTTTVNVFKRTSEITKENKEQSAVLRLAAMLPGVTAAGMDALRAGSIVRFESVAAEVGHAVKGEVPSYVITKDAAKKLFEDSLKNLLDSGHLRPLHGLPFYVIHPPAGSVRQELTIPFAIELPKQEKMPWE